MPTDQYRTWHASFALALDGEDDEERCITICTKHGYACVGRISPHVRFDTLVNSNNNNVNDGKDEGVGSGSIVKLPGSF